MHRVDHGADIDALVEGVAEAKAVHPSRSAYDHLRALAVTNGISTARVDEVLVAIHRQLEERDLINRIGAGVVLTGGGALLKDPEVNVRYQAAVSLGNLGKKEAAQYLNKALEDEEWIQFAVIEALSKIREASSVGALAMASQSASRLLSVM